MVVAPLCPLFGTCGGCSFQDIPYEQQVAQKLAQVKGFFQENNVPLPEEVPVITDKPFGYRSRMDFAFSFDGPGLRRKGRFWDINPVRECALSNENLNKLLAEVWLFFEQERANLDVFTHRENLGTIKYAVIRTPGISGRTCITFILNRESPRLEEHINLLKKFAEHCTADTVLYGAVGAKQDLSIAKDIVALKGDIFLEEILCGKLLRFHSQAFFQNNSSIAEKMLQHVRGLIADTISKHLLLVDLYGGAGTFGVTLADLFKKVLVIDNDPGNILSAKENISINNIINAEAKCADAQAILELPPQNMVLMLDPPRCGLHPKVFKRIIELKPERIVYVSCNPKQLAVELALFKEFYEIKTLTVFDHFPQTPHIEAISLLTLK